MTKILAIDDKPDNLLVLRALLKTFLPESILITALSGKEGIKKALDEGPDTIILDVQMPEMDGYEVCQLLKAGPSTRHIPIVMLTAVHTNSKSKAHGLEVGADAFLTKPVDEIEFVAQVKAMLRIKKSEDLLRRDKEVLEIQVQRRTRELQCLYNILNIANNSGSSFDDMIQKIADVLPPAWQHPEFTCASIEINGKRFKTKNFKRSSQGQSCEILLAEKKIGEIAVYSLKEKSNLEVNPFLSKEQSFLHEVAEQLKKLAEQEIAIEEKARLEKQLQQAQKMGAIGTLAGGIAHDFNNILSAIIGFTELSMDSRLLDKQLEDDLHEVYAAALRAKTLVDQILTFSRKQDVKISAIYAPPLIKEAIKLLRATLPASVQMNVNVDESVGLVLADPTQLHQIVMNISTNAVYSMEAGGTLTVKVSEITLSDLIHSRYPTLIRGKYLELSFQDTGTGIEPENLDAIFEPYFTTKHLGDGTGLGLATIYGIVQGMGGAIMVESEVGKGSTFTVLIPITTEPIQEHDVRGSHDLEPSCEQAHILLVDDEPPILKLTSRHLESSGYIVTAENNGENAFERFAENPFRFDLLISDITMPKLTGDVLAEKVLAIRPDLPIFLATGYNKNITEESVSKIGAKGLLQKPFTKEALLGKIRKILEEKAQ